jgi:hypothetical protein
MQASEIISDLRRLRHPVATAAAAELEAVRAECDRLREALRAWRVAFCHRECVSPILDILRDEYAEFVDECLLAMEETKKAEGLL